MGLDIYLHKVKVLDETKNEFKSKGFANAMEVANEQNRDALRKAFKSTISAIERQNVKDSFGTHQLYQKKVKSLFKYFSYPEFHLKEIGVSSEWNGKKYEHKIVPTDAIFNNELVDKIIKDSYAPSIAYWRKVNFIYAYIDKLGLLNHDDECAWVEKEDIEDLISRCEKVLANKDTKTNEDLLPTQSGFFFGSTDYDKWYYYDVEDTIKQLKKVLRGLKDDEQCFFYFSW